VGSSRPGYVFDTAWERERERLAANERYWDPFSIRILKQLGIGEGMRVLDVGAGGGTIAQWFARHVAPSGSVLAVDLDPRFIMALDEPNLEARRMDLFADEFPRVSFDVVHARCLLEHLPERVRALERLIAAARPGGLVAVCDFGGELGGPMHPTPDDLLVQQVFAAVVSEAGWDHTVEGDLPGGYTDIGAKTVSGVGKVSARRLRGVASDKAQAVKLRALAENLAAFWSAVSSTDNAERRAELIEKYGARLVLESNRYATLVEELGLRGPYDG